MEYIFAGICIGIGMILAPIVLAMVIIVTSLTIWGIIKIIEEIQKLLY
jgi:hypothetical protein